MLVPSSAQAGKPPVPAVNESGSPVFDQLRNEAVRKKIPLVIYITGSAWCGYCNIFTGKHIKEPSFHKASGRKFVFWLVDTGQEPGRSPGSFKFKFIPEEAAKVVGCLDSWAPYTVFGPPAVIILDPVSGKVIKKMEGLQDVEKEGKPLAGIIEDCWKEFGSGQKKSS